LGFSITHPLIVSLRVKQWIKNVLLFTPLLFSKQIFDISRLFDTILGFLIFCIVTSAIYLFNDVEDREEDRKHPLKCFRPVAAGLLRISLAISSAIVLAGIALGLSFFLNQNFFYIIAVYIILQVLYTFILKHIVILDVFCVAAGFFIRVIAGALVSEVSISYWLIICTILLSLFLALAKRRHEQVALGEEAINHRKIFKDYSPYFLDQMIGVVTASTLISYILYTVSPETVSKFHTHWLLATFPFVLYGIFRYLYLVHQKQLGGNPEIHLFTDKPLLVNIILWAVTAFLIVYVFK
jgi:4-hydroxybenzoate polyprenyltransferase